MTGVRLASIGLRGLRLVFAAAGANDRRRGTRRQHVQDQITATGVPFTTTTLRQGSPHKLVVGKPSDLLARDRAQREVDTGMDRLRSM